MRSKGFTLIEVLIAMTLLSVMMAMLFGVLALCGDGWEQAEDKMTKVNGVATTYNFFQRDLSKAVPLTNIQSEFSFQGESQSLKFVSYFPASANKPGPQLFDIHLNNDSDDEDGKTIEVTVTPYSFEMNESASDDSETEVLLSHVDEISFRYYGDLDQSGNLGPHTEWLNQSVQPRAVGITIKQKDYNLASGEISKPIFWPEMLIEIKIQNPASNLGF